MRLVVDTNVVVSGILSPHGPPATVLRALLSGRAILCYDERILDEYRDVLTRGKFAFDPDVVGELLGFLEAAGERVLSEPLRLHLPDPADAVFIEVARSAGADCVVTGNLRHFPPDSRQGCRVATPRELLEDLL